jgi:hypothetical protein
VVAEAGGDDSGDVLVDHLVFTDAAAGEGDGPLDVAECDEHRLVVGALNGWPGGRIAQRPENGHRLGGAEGGVDGSDVLPGGTAGNQQLAGSGIAAFQTRRRSARLTVPDRPSSGTASPRQVPAFSRSRPVRPR